MPNTGSALSKVTPNLTRGAKETPSAGATHLDAFEALLMGENSL
jgi:hypothetical protein